MRRFLYALAGIAGGYLAGVGIGAAAITLLSSNTHDGSVEMAMTAAFVTGPIGAVIGLVVALMRGRNP
jgi:hypothetical protein